MERRRSPPPTRDSDGLAGRRLRARIRVGEECRAPPGHAGGLGHHRRGAAHGRVPGAGVFRTTRPDRPAVFCRADPRSFALRMGGGGRACPRTAVEPLLSLSRRIAGSSVGSWRPRLGGAPRLDPHPSGLVCGDLHRRRPSIGPTPFGAGLWRSSSNSPSFPDG